MQKFKDFVNKLFVILFCALFLTAYIYAIGIIGKDAELNVWFASNKSFLDYMIFTIQLLMGGLTYDILKLILKSDLSWSEISKYLKEAVTWFVVMLAALIAASSVKENDWIFVLLLLLALYKSVKSFVSAMDIMKSELKKGSE